MAFSPIPREWLHEPPESIVAGGDSYSVALATILGTAIQPFDLLHAGPEPNSAGGYPRVLESLERVFLVVSEHMLAPDVLECHQIIWNWIVKLSSAGDQHEVAFLFVLPENASSGFEETLAVGLSVPVIHPVATGHAVWRRSGSLWELLNLVATIVPMDLVPLMARRTLDAKRLALARLCIAVTQDDPIEIGIAARVVLDSFRPREHHLDLFCRPPSHQHGNLLRTWLNASVNGPITPDWCAIGRDQLRIWLAEEANKDLP